MNKIKVVILAAVCFISLYGCSRDKYSYYSEENDFAFKIQSYNDSIDVMTLGTADSIFYLHPLHGNFMELSFYVLSDSNTVYLGSMFPVVRCVEKNYHFCKINYDFNTNEIPEPYKGHEYWGYVGNADQGSYTFDAWHNSSFVGTLEPLEWK